MENVKLIEPEYVCKTHFNRTLDIYCTEEHDLICSFCQINHLPHSNKFIILDSIREELIEMEKLLD